MRIDLLLTAFLLSFSLNGYSQSWAWAVNGGGGQSDKGNDIARDASGNIYVTGYFNNSATFGSYNLGQNSPSKEVFVAKLNPSGNFLWARRGTNFYDDRGLGVCTDPFGNVYATGTCWSEIDFSGNYVNNGGWSDEIFIVKYDAAGVVQWVDLSGVPYGDDHGFDLVSDKAGNIYVTGFISDGMGFGDPANFGSITVNAPLGDTAAFLGKISAAGTWQWIRTFGGFDGERDNRIAIDSKDNLYITGGFRGTRTFGSTTLTSQTGNADVFVVKYDSNGNFQWVRSGGSNLDDRGNGITVDPNDNLYITGEFRHRAGFGSDSLNNNGGPKGRDIFVARMKADGTWLWAKKAGWDGGGDRGNGICANAKGNIFVTGQFNDTAKFGNITINTQEGLQAFVAAIDTNGKWRWAVEGGGLFEDRGNGITCDDSCTLYTTGYYRSGSSFGGFTLNGIGGKDVFVASIDNACFDYTETVDSITECDIFVPNAFSPNGDGRNDLECVLGNCLKSSHFTIFNRWGEVVFETTNMSECWDGTWKGELQNTGVFVYYLVATNQKGDLFTKKGNVTLMR